MVGTTDGGHKSRSWPRRRARPCRWRSRWISRVGHHSLWVQRTSIWLAHRIGLDAAQHRRFFRWSQALGRSRHCQSQRSMRGLLQLVCWQSCPSEPCCGHIKKVFATALHDHVSKEKMQKRKKNMTAEWCRNQEDETAGLVALKEDQLQQQHSLVHALLLWLGRV